jgi:mannose-6-phosphate isomerase-like protein (cupin superfamily)
MENKTYPLPHIIQFPELGNGDIGFISVAESQVNLPFFVKRIFWTYQTPETIVRGRHAHHETEQVLIAITGRIVVTIFLGDETTEIFVLDKPSIGLYIPPNAWHTMQYYNDPVQMVFASTNYLAEDYIRSFDRFREIYGPKS